MSQTDTTTVARNNQVPPELRRFARTHCRGVDRITRFAPEHERFARGWTIFAEHVSVHMLPDGFETHNVTVNSTSDTFRLQVREA